jgi:hypothetical protein
MGASFWELLGVASSRFMLLSEACSSDEIKKQLFPSLSDTITEQTFWTFCSMQAC